MNRAAVRCSDVMVQIRQSFRAPLNLRRAAIIGAMYLALVFVLTVPLLQDFFGLEWPRNDLLLTALGSALGGILAIEALHRFQSRRNARK